MSTFIAAFDGQLCGTCDVMVREGDEVQYDLSGRLVHVECPDPHIDTPPTAAVCFTCYELLPVSGICGNCA